MHLLLIVLTRQEPWTKERVHGLHFNAPLIRQERPRIIKQQCIISLRKYWWQSSGTKYSPATNKLNQAGNKLRLHAELPLYWWFWFTEHWLYPRILPPPPVLIEDRKPQLYTSNKVRWYQNKIRKMEQSALKISHLITWHLLGWGHIKRNKKIGSSKDTLETTLAFKAMYVLYQWRLVDECHVKPRTPTEHVR